MHKRIVFAVSAVLFAILAVVAVVVADSHDRGSPVQLGAKSMFSLDFADSGMSDEEAFQLLGTLSDRLELGLVKIAPNLSGDQTGQVFVIVGAQGDFPEKIRRFGEQPDAKIKDSEALENSYASSQYLITSETANIAEFENWLESNQIASERYDDSLSNVLQFMVRQSSFATSLLAAAALMVSLVLYWLSVKAKGRALRVLAGVPTLRIQYEDLIGFAAAMSSAAVLCGTSAIVYVGIAHGWIFVPYYAWALLNFYVVVIVATMACAVAMSVASWPSASMLAAREPAVKSLRKASMVLKVATFVLVLAAVAPAYSAFANAKETAAEQAQWKSLSDQVALSFDGGGSESDFRELMPSVSELAKDAEQRNAVALSYTWSNEFANGEIEPYAYLSFVNQRWLDLMLEEEQEGNDGGNQPTPSLISLSQDQVPNGLRRFIGEEIAFQSRDRMSADEALANVSLYRYAGPGTLPVADGGEDLIFSENTIIVVVPSVHSTFNDQFLAATASSSNLVFTGLGPTQELVEQHGLQKEVNVKYLAEEGVLRAQLAAYFAWLQGISLLALVVALVVAAVIGAFITAVLKARRDFPLRLAGKRWTEILAGRVIKEWTIGIALAVLVILPRGLDGSALVAGAAVTGLLISPLIHIMAARWAFANVSLRRL